MGGIRDLLPTLHYYGIDTETYNNPTNGLKSIQCAGNDELLYFSTDAWDQDDLSIRFEISKKFIDWLDQKPYTCYCAFFNLDFDFSQFSYYLITQSQYTYVEHNEILKKHQLRILESDRKIYKVEMVNANGKRILMLDIANFLTATNLNRACNDWIGKSKIDIDSKDFLKSPPTEIEKEYALQDAKLTYELYLKLIETGVIEDKTVTIAGRTIRHFEEHLKNVWGISFNRFAFGTDDKELIAQYTAQNE
jgi:hypothetical protein